LPVISRAACSTLALILLAAGPTFADEAADCSKGDIPAGPLKGTLNGAPFAADSVTLAPIEKRTQGPATFDDYHIYLKSNDGTVLDLTAITLTGKLPDGKTFRSGLNGDSPEAGPGSPEIQGWTINNAAKNLEIGFYEVNDASLQLVFGARAGDALPAQLHFCVPSKASEIGGSFTIPLK
jgi:hypothetical protein